MISITREECQWLLGNLARGLVEYLGVVEPPAPVEGMLKHPPGNFDMDFGVVNMYSHLWDATFARTPSQRGSIFVRIDLNPEERRYSLAREALTAVVTSEHGRALGRPAPLDSRPAGPPARRPATRAPVHCLAYEHRAHRLPGANGHTCPHTIGSLRHSLLPGPGRRQLPPLGLCPRRRRPGTPDHRRLQCPHPLHHPRCRVPRLRFRPRRRVGPL